VDYSGEVGDMIEAISACGVDPCGWMVFSSDHLVSEETFQVGFNLHTHTYIYIYIERERERARPVFLKTIDI
jgi:hypothetical protein